MIMNDPRFEEQTDEGSKWAWVPGAIFAVAVVGGVALWAYSTGDLQQSAARGGKDTTTGQSTAPARPAPPAPQR
jgi:hypothetical protein